MIDSTVEASFNWYDYGYDDYDVYLNGSKVANQITNSYVIKNLTYGDNDNFYIIANDGTKQLQSNTIIFNTLKFTLTATKQTNNNIKLDWTITPDSIPTYINNLKITRAYIIDDDNHEPMELWTFKDLTMRSWTDNNSRTSGSIVYNVLYEDLYGNDLEIAPYIVIDLNNSANVGSSLIGYTEIG